MGATNEMNDRDISIPPPPPDTEIATPVGKPKAAQILLVTGMSGAGRTTVLKCLEDLGFEAVDNVPLTLLSSLAAAIGWTSNSDSASQIAIGIDIRSRNFGIDAFLAEANRLDESGDRKVTVLFLDCDDDELCRRYTETRHRHPLAQDRPPADGITHERRLVAPLRDRADMVIDTTDLKAFGLDRIIRDHFDPEREPGISIVVTSFGFSNGLPRDTDIVFDVRFLKNPYYVAELQPLTGRDQRVAAYIDEDDGFETFFTDLTGLISSLLSQYVARGRPCLTIAVGCTGGQHRSVYVTERLCAWIDAEGYRVEVRHRDS
jgi:UPF0042 nucleotide-binding protein